MSNPEKNISAETNDNAPFNIRISTGMAYVERMEKMAPEPSSQEEIRFLLDYYDSVQNVTLGELNRRVEIAQRGIVNLIEISSGEQLVDSLGKPFRKTLDKNSLHETIAMIRAISFVTSIEGIPAVGRLRKMLEESITLESEFTSKFKQESQLSEQMELGFNSKELEILEKNIDLVHYFYNRFRKAQDEGLFDIADDQELVREIQKYLDEGFPLPILKDLAWMNGFQWKLEDSGDISYDPEQYVNLFKGIGKAGRGMVIEGLDNAVRSNQIYHAMVKANKDFYTVESFSGEKRPPKSPSEYQEIIQKRKEDYRKILEKKNK